MDTVTFFALIIAAFFHAGWNSIAYRSGNAELALMRTMPFIIILCVGGVVHYGLPQGNFGFLLFLSIVIHTLYKIALVMSYKNNAFTLAYPLARGLAPLFVVLYSVIFFPVGLSFTMLLAVFVLVAGLLILVVTQYRMTGENIHITYFPIMTALMIASYVVIDGIVVTKLGNAPAYLFLLMLLDSIVFLVYGMFRYDWSKIFLQKKEGYYNLVGAGMNVGSYWIALWAIETTTIASVSALRELSIVFSVLIAMIWMKASFRFIHFLAITLIACGAISIKFVS